MQILYIMLRKICKTRGKMYKPEKLHEKFRNSPRSSPLNPSCTLRVSIRKLKYLFWVRVGFKNEKDCRKYNGAEIFSGMIYRSFSEQSVFV